MMLVGHESGSHVRWVHGQLEEWTRFLPSVQLCFIKWLVQELAEQLDRGSWQLPLFEANVPQSSKPAPKRTHDRADKECLSLEWIEMSQRAQWAEERVKEMTANLCKMEESSQQLQERNKELQTQLEQETARAEKELKKTRALQAETQSLEAELAHLIVASEENGRLMKCQEQRLKEMSANFRQMEKSSQQLQERNKELQTQLEQETGRADKELENSRLLQADTQNLEAEVAHLIVASTENGRLMKGQEQRLKEMNAHFQQLQERNKELQTQLERETARAEQEKKRREDYFSREVAYLRKELEWWKWFHHNTASLYSQATAESSSSASQQRQNDQRNRQTCMDPRRPAPPRLDASVDDHVLYPLKNCVFEELKSMAHEDNKDRERLWKKLQLRWHPDKNPQNSKISHDIFVFIEAAKPWFMYDPNGEGR